MKLVGITLLIVGIISFLSGALILSTKEAQSYDTDIIMMMRLGYYALLLSAVVYIFYLLFDGLMNNSDIDN
ncbi:hypothetical protein WOB53_03555 [Providencia rettgeri]|uniref:hypothetical protein n=1 Tax=Providencia TaxID=586 RepID=UPI001E5D5672|nr:MULTISPECIES: hypothetical protein [Providencia]UEK58363.1 hypothetical protein LL668_13725 [Providencia rettgeri]